VNAIQPGLIRTAMTAGLPSAVVAQIHEEQSSPLGAAIWHRVEDEVEPAGFVGELGEARS
jgi:NAD(P)-dependent dehydrogenase (short-subunit alcohol dehydrogenase family)